MIKDDTEKLAGYLGRLEQKGVTEVALYPGGGDTCEIFSIAQVRDMLG